MEPREWSDFSGTLKNYFHHILCKNFQFLPRSLLVGLTVSLDYWWTLRGLEEVASVDIH